MRFKHLYFILFFTACKPMAPVSSEDKSHFRNEKTIKYLYKIENEISTTYESNGLQRKDNCIYKDSILLHCDVLNYQSFKEIFDKRYLLISIGKNRSNTWSGVDTVSKDSMYICDLKTYKKSYISLKNTNFTYSKKSLAKMYHFKVELDESYTYRYAIESINLERNELILIDPNFKIVEYKLTPVK